MKLLKILLGLAPHLLITLAGMFLTFFIIDKHKRAMEFINNDISKGLIWSGYNILYLRGGDDIQSAKILNSTINVAFDLFSR